MKQFLILLSTLIFVMLNPGAFYAEDRPALSPECQEQAKVRDSLYNKGIMRDIISTFNLDINENSYGELSLKDLLIAHILYGGQMEDTYFNSLITLFSNLNTRGEPRLFVKPLNAYFLYKKSDNTNVMVRLTLENKKWTVIETQKKMGKPIEYKLLKCEEENIKKD